MRVFGPVPSRRLGRSVGINNIPPKNCTYSCIYCQIGATRKMFAERQEFYQPQELVEEAVEKVNEAQDCGESIDYLTFVADGEPTLDFNLGKTIQLLKPLGIKIAVITNSSLLWRKDVRSELMLADWVSVKVDSVTYHEWKKVDCPHRFLDLEKILEGIKLFSDSYSGYLATETMLINGINHSRESLSKTASFIAEVSPEIAYLAIPTRPPTKKWVKSPAEEEINQAYQIFKQKISNVEYLIGFEGTSFSATGDIQKDILSITAVHPMREDALKDFLQNSPNGWELIEELIRTGKLKETEYGGQKYYLRKFAEVQFK